MRRITSIFFFVSLLISFGAHAQFSSMMISGPTSGGGLNGFSHARAITFSHLKVPSTQANFTVDVVCTSHTDTVCNSVDLRTTANGGFIQNTASFNGQTVPTDLTFTSDAGCTTNLSWEVASYTASTGAIENWVLIPSLSSSVDTVIYMCYGKAALTSYAGGAVGAAWNSNYLGVYHLANGTTLGDGTNVNDSTVHANNGPITGFGSTAGLIDGGASSTVAAKYIKFPTSTISTFYGGPNWTFSTWFYLNTVDSNTALIGAIPYASNSTPIIIINGVCGAGIWVVSAGSSCPLGPVAVPSTGVWHHIVIAVSGVFGDNTASVSNLYLDSVLVSGPTGYNWNYGGFFSNPTQQYGLGEDGTSSGGNSINGNFDESHWMTSTETPDQITTEYNNQGTPSTFYSVGTQI